MIELNLIDFDQGIFNLLRNVCEKKTRIDIICLKIALNPTKMFKEAKFLLLIKNIVREFERFHS